MAKTAILKNVFFAALALLGAYLVLKYLVPFTLPFLIALGIAAVFNRPIKLLHKRTRLSPKILSALFLILTLFFIGFLIFVTVNRLVSELEGLISSLSSNSDKYVASFFAFIDGIANKLPFLKSFGGDLSATVSDAVKNLIARMTAHIPSIIAGILGMLPEILVFTVIIILAGYYFCADYDAVKEKLLSFLPQSARDALHRFKERLKDTGISYLKACGIMMVITYFELLVGFLMLGIPYALTLSLAVAAVDMLPIFGVGTVLIPWAIWCQITGDTYTAVGLMIIFTTVTIVRQFIEPKIISNGIGLSPVTTLVAMYVGFKLFGLIGLFFAPLAAILILHALPQPLAQKLGLSPKKEKEQKIVVK